MPKLVPQITVNQIKAFTKPGVHAAGNGLYLQIDKAGHKSWILRYTFSTRRRDMGLGSLHKVTLAQAREAARKAHDLIRQDIDPIEERKQKRTVKVDLAPAPVTFAQVTREYLRFKDHKGRHARNIAGPIYTYIVPALGKLPVATITSAQIHDAFMTKTNSGEPFWEARQISSRILGTVIDIFEYAQAKGWRESPISRKQLTFAGLKPQTHRTDHYAAVPYKLVPEFFARLEQYRGVNIAYLQWVILVAARSNEGRILRWEWIDSEKQLVTIPADEMKSERAHVIPLSGAAWQVLERMREVRVSDYVFPGTSWTRQEHPHRGVLHELAGLKTARRIMPEIELTTHGFRSSFKDWVKEETIFEDDMSEIALAHQVGTKVAQAYQRGNLLQKRRTMMETWATYCQTGHIDPRYRSEFAAAAD